MWDANLSVFLNFSVCVACGLLSRATGPGNQLVSWLKGTLGQEPAEMAGECRRCREMAETTGREE